MQWNVLLFAIAQNNLYAIIKNMHRQCETGCLIGMLNKKRNQCLKNDEMKLKKNHQTNKQTVTPKRTVFILSSEKFRLVLILRFGISVFIFISLSIWVEMFLIRFFCNSIFTTIAFVLVLAIKWFNLFTYFLFSFSPFNHSLNVMQTIFISMYSVYIRTLLILFFLSHSMSITFDLNESKKVHAKAFFSLLRWFVRCFFSSVTCLYFVCVSIFFVVSLTNEQNPLH